VHEYFGINYDTIWQTVNSKLEKLKFSVEELIKGFE
jgi:uncharacterized protein with HEPN domain